jgi:hypothetical protein
VEKVYFIYLRLFLVGNSARNLQGCMSLSSQERRIKAHNDCTEALIAQCNADIYFNVALDSTRCTVLTLTSVCSFY